MSSKVTCPCGRVVEPPSASRPEFSPKQASERLSKYEILHHLNRSAAREVILNVLLGMDRHFTALTLARKVQGKKPSVGPATVYRNLPIFVAAGILRESLMDERGQILYELATVHHHDHMVCVDCHQIIEFQDETIEKHQKSILEHFQFSEVSHRHVLYGRCRILKRNTEEAPSSRPRRAK